MEMLKSACGDREGLTEFEQTLRIANRDLVVRVQWVGGG